MYPFVGENEFTALLLKSTGGVHRAPKLKLHLSSS